MARIFITGSSDGLGLMAGRDLVARGHDVVLHARDDAKARATRSALPDVRVLVADVSSIAATRALADAANATGPFDAVIHNVGVGYREPRRIATVDGLPHVLAVNTLAPFVLTALMHRPRRLVYLSSGLHRSGDPSLDDLTWTKRAWNGIQAYSDTKLHDTLLAFAAGRRWPDACANSVEPGWVATKMGGAGATDDLARGAVTQSWLAVSDDPAALVSGRHFFHERERAASPAALDTARQDRLIAECERLTGVTLPAT